MVRRTSSARSSRGKAKKVSVDFSNVGKMFEEDMEYPVEVKSCTLEEGDAAPYFAFQFVGMDEDYAETIMYHNASTSPQSLWRLKPLLEAFGMEIPDGPLDIDPDELVGMQCMCSTIKEKRPGGGSNIRPDEFWPLNEADKTDKKSTKDDDKSARGRRGKQEDEEPTIDLDAMSDDDIEKLADEFQIEGRTIDKLKAGLAKCDVKELAEACNDLGIDIGGGEKEEEAPRGRRGRGAKDEGEGKEAGSSRRSRSSSKKDEEEDAPKGRGRSSRGSEKSKPKLSGDDIDEMSEEELEDVVADNKLDVDLDEHRTLRKKKNAVKDALEAEGLLAD